MRKISWGWVAVAAVPVVFIGYFFIYPVARILGLGLAELNIGVNGLEARLLVAGNRFDDLDPCRRRTSHLGHLHI